MFSDRHLGYPKCRCAQRDRHAIEYPEVECGFFRPDQLLRSGEGVAQNINVGQRAYFGSPARLPDADSTECRISDVRPREISSDPPQADQITAVRAATMALLTLADFNGDRPRQGPGKPPQLFLDALEKASADAIRTAGITGPDDPEAIRKAA